MSFFDSCWGALCIVIACICLFIGAIAYQSCFIQLHNVVIVGILEFVICFAVLIPALKDARDEFYQRYLIIRSAMNAFRDWYISFHKLHPEILKYSKFLAPLGVMIQFWSAASFKPAKAEWNTIMNFKLHIGTTSTYLVILMAGLFMSYTLHLHTFYYPLISFGFAISTICLCIYSCFQMLIIPDKRVELKISNYLFSLLKLPLTYDGLLRCNLKESEAFIHELKAVLGYRASSSRSRKGSLLEIMIKELNSIRTDKEQERADQEDQLCAIHFAIGLCWAHLHDLGQNTYDKYLVRMSRIWAKHDSIKNRNAEYSFKHYHALQYGLACGELLVSINVSQEKLTIAHIEEMIKQYGLKKAYVSAVAFHELRSRCSKKYSRDISFLESLVDKHSSIHKKTIKDIIDYFDAE